MTTHYRFTKDVKDLWGWCKLVVFKFASEFVRIPISIQDSSWPKSPQHTAFVKRYRFPRGGGNKSLGLFYISRISEKQIKHLKSNSHRIIGEIPEELKELIVVKRDALDLESVDYEATLQVKLSIAREVFDRVDHKLLQVRTILRINLLILSGKSEVWGHNR